jgi:hypothetical protein
VFFVIVVLLAERPKAMRWPTNAAPIAQPKPKAEQGKDRLSESRQKRIWESEGI